jgi:hypothetical protein
MKTPRRRTRLLLLALAALLAALFWFVLLKPAAVEAGTMIELRPPPLAQMADAQQESAGTAGVSTIAAEAGIAAYFNAGAPVNLDSVADQFVTIEARTDNYILGSVSVPQYNERHQVHVYVHKDGWFMAYYLAEDPAAKMVDIKSYGGAGISTKFDTILALLAGEAGVPFVQPTYWDFRSPNANHMMVVAETYTSGDDFTMKLPSTYIFYDMSWVSGGSLPGLLLDGAKLSDSYWADDGVAQGAISANVLTLDVTHTFQVNASGKGAVVLIYRVP